MKRILISLSILVIVHFSTSLMAQIPRVINYQGVLLGSNEQPVPEGDYKITFNLYDDGNNLLWSEVHNNVYVGGGIFHVILGTVTPLNIPFDQPYFLGMYYRVHCLHELHQLQSILYSYVHINWRKNICHEYKYQVHFQANQLQIKARLINDRLNNCR